MKTIVILAVYFTTVFSVLAFPPIVPHDNCHFYIENGGIAEILTNKHWAIQKVYVDSIPLPDDLFTNIQYLFNKDGQLIMLKNPQSVQPEATGYDYIINESTHKIQVKAHGTSNLLQEFNVICLNAGHLAFYYDTPTLDDPNKIVRMEFRFLVDYSWENKIIQNALNNPNQ